MASIELRTATGSAARRLEGDRLTIGKAPSNDIAVTDDATMSRLHAVFERFPSGWAIRDLGSRNGTFVNGERIWGERALRPSDEVRVGKTRVVYRGDVPMEEFTATEAPQRAPDLTPRERDVLVSLCKPLLSGDAFSEPASVGQIADDLVVTKAAVKQHLLRLYDKFGLHDDDGPRRIRLANDALERGAVTLADLRRDA
jgi:DNA-binding CsgD family transcriptional regulator